MPQRRPRGARALHAAPVLTLALAAAVAAPAMAAHRPAHERAQGFPQPPIVQKPIPFGPDRRAETVRYSRMHYGPALAGWRLDPKVIVEHYTASDSFSSAWNTFAANAPDGELGQLPGTCAHFIVDQDGTIYALVPTTVRCRHTVGLNHVAIGIEMVGTSDAQILANRRQLTSALRLTRWLQGRYGIADRNVIGHSESLSSPFHRELYGPWRTQTHGDWSAADMRVFRARLRAVPPS